jgi:protein SCO1/2
MRFPPLPEGALFTSHTGKKIDIAQAVRGKHALLAFGALHSTDQPLLECMARATDSAKKRTGMDIVPVYVSIDPVHDKPEDLKIAAGRSGSPSMLVVTGPSDRLLEAAERFKNVVIAQEQADKKGTELQKKLGPASMASTYTSDYYYLIDQAGRIIGMMPKKMRTEEIAGNLAQDMQRSNVNMIP